MRSLIIPAILADTIDDAEKKLASISQATRWLQLDIADGKFTAKKTWAAAEEARHWPTRLKLELHLMVEQPAAVMQAWRKVKQVKRVIWPAELPMDHRALISACHKRGWQAGLSINPETPVASLVPYLQHVDTALILGVRPGGSGQPLIRSTLKKVSDVRRLAPRLIISFDGGITARNLAALAKLGVNHFCLSSAIFSKKQPTQALRQLQQHVRDAKKMLS